MEKPQPAENILSVATSTEIMSGPMLFLTEKWQRYGTCMMEGCEPSRGNAMIRRCWSVILVNVPVTT